MRSARAAHTATPLPDGRILVAGGQSGRTTLLDTAVVYDPADGRWRGAGRLDAAKYKLALAALPTGGALLVGGQTADAREARLDRTEVFDPVAAAFDPGPRLAQPRYKLVDAVVALPDGRVVVAGGTAVEVYARGALTVATTVPGPERQAPAAAALPDGSVLVTGGYDNSTRVTATAFVFAAPARR